MFLGHESLQANALNLDESFGIGWTESALFIHGRHLFVIQGKRRRSTFNHDIALVEFDLKMSIYKNNTYDELYRPRTFGSTEQQP